jgi:DNA invertase Pin-like site-specific DNA recombinase
MYFEYSENAAAAACRIGRLLHDLIAFLDDLKERKIQFQSLTESINTKTPTGRAMWQMIGILAELERSFSITNACCPAATKRRFRPKRNKKSPR